MNLPHLELHSLLMAALGFTPASGQDVFSIEATQPSSSKTTGGLNGDEARQFYENLMTDDEDASRGDGGGEHQRNRESSRRVRRRVRAAATQRGQTESVGRRGISGRGEGHQRRETVQSERSTELLGLRLLRCAHAGDVSGLKELLSKGVDINFQVQYLLLSVFFILF